MRKHGWDCFMRRMLALTLLLTSGCSLPHRLGLMEEPADASPPSSRRNVAHIMPPLLSTAPAQNDMNSYQIQRVAALADDKKLLMGRLQQIESQLEDKSHLLSEAQQEIHTTMDAIAQTKKEQKKESEALQADIRRLTKENKDYNVLLQQLIEMLEKERLRKGKEPPTPGPDNQGVSFPP